MADFLADSTQSHESERLAAQLQANEALPLAIAQAEVSWHDVPGQCQQQAQRQVGH
jgi:hypothetical protein